MALDIVAKYKKLAQPLMAMLALTSSPSGENKRAGIDAARFTRQKYLFNS
jgi:hypothetical protein